MPTVIETCFKLLYIEEQETLRELRALHWFNFFRRSRLENHRKLVQAARELLRCDQANILNHNWGVIQPGTRKLYLSEYDPQNLMHQDLIVINVPRRNHHGNKL